MVDPKNKNGEMPFILYNSRYFMRFLPLLLLAFTLFSCGTDFKETKISLDNYKIEDGFDLSMVASEPLLDAPVAIDFDDKGRIWVAEMTGFMSNVDGTGENLPTGSIKILEDQDDDGVMDHAKVFLDSLVLPRAVALVYGGLLYAEPPNLWFVEIENDKPGNKVLVDSLYAPEGNPEYQPNGLRLNIDNWIYNAGSHFRYQRKDGNWVKEPTTFRGQWGMTQDNFGRLYYNNNSTQLLGDYVLPNRLVRNQYLVPKHGVNQKLTKDQRVYPLHAAAVNRGYIKGVLDKDSVLVEVTASCGPLVYRGGAFPEDYAQNVFVCIPEANLIKRNILSFEGDRVEARQAYEGKEFLASTDEGFRPVSMSDSPDGSLYIVDMHRGVIQHHAFLSPYLKEKAKEKKLDTLVNFGRILRVSNTNVETQNIPDLEKLTASELVELLKHKNGWLRDHAQHELIYNKKTEAVADLIELAQNTDFPLAQLHALYALKGLDNLSFDLLHDIAQSSGVDVVSHVLVLLEDYIVAENTTKAHGLFEKLMVLNDASIDLYLTFSLGKWAALSENSFFPLLSTLDDKYRENPIYQEAILSGVTDPNSGVLAAFKKKDDENNLLRSLAESTLKRKEEDKKNPIFVNNGRGMDSRTNGAKLFRQICAACHQGNGDGIEGMAPPLVNSEHVTNPRKLALIMLHGLKGPIHVNGTLYEMNHVMPGIGNNQALTDKDVADIISYVGNAFSDYPRSLNSKKVEELREVKSESGAEYTIEELEDVLKTLPSK